MPHQTHQISPSERDPVLVMVNQLIQKVDALQRDVIDHVADEKNMVSDIKRILERYFGVPDPNDPHDPGSPKMHKMQHDFVQRLIEREISRDNFRRAIIRHSTKVVATMILLMLIGALADGVARVAGFDTHFARKLAERAAAEP